MSGGDWLFQFWINELAMTLPPHFLIDRDPGDENDHKDNENDVAR